MTYNPIPPPTQTTSYEVCERGDAYGRTGAYIASADTEETAVDMAREMHRATGKHYHVLRKDIDPYASRRLIFTTIADEQVRRARQGDLLK